MRKHLLFWLVVGILALSLLVGMLSALFERGDHVERKQQDQYDVAPR
jgi:hypothetical protein